MDALSYYAIPGLGLAAYVLYAFIQLTLGQRREAMVTLWTALAALALGASALAGMTLLSNQVTKAIMGGLSGEYALPGTDETVTLYFSYDRAWESLSDAAKVFKRAAEASIWWVVFPQYAKGVLAITEILAPIPSLIDAATGWAVGLLLWAPTFFATLWYACEVLQYVHPWLLAFGLALVFVPRLQRIGGTLLATYIVTGVALTGMAAWVAENVLNAEIGLSVLGLTIDKFASTPDVTDIAANVAAAFLATVTAKIGEVVGMAATIAVKGVIFCGVAVALASGVAVSLSELLGGVSAALLGRLGI